MHSHDDSLHAHGHGDALHPHFHTSTSGRVLLGAMLLTLGFAAVETVFGFLSGSLALISDAGHMVTDSAALALALLGQAVARRAPSARYSFGFGRAEALAAFVNSLVMLAVIVWIVWQAAARLYQPVPVAAGTVIWVAAIGLMVNVAVAWLLSRDQENMNTRAALVHVMGDLLGSVAALIAGLVIEYTGWTQVDPLLSLLVAVLLLRSTIGLLRQSFHMLMEGVPQDVDYTQVGADLRAVPGVRDLHDLHVWEMAPGHPALIAHVIIDDLGHWPQVLEKIRAMLRERHDIDHVTMQPEAGDAHAHEAGSGGVHAGPHAH